MKRQRQRSFNQNQQVDDSQGRGCRQGRRNRMSWCFNQQGNEARTNRQRRCARGEHSS